MQSNALQSAPVHRILFMCGRGFPAQHDCRRAAFLASRSKIAGEPDFAVLPPGSSGLIYAVRRMKSHSQDGSSFEAQASIIFRMRSSH